MPEFGYILFEVEGKNKKSLLHQRIATELHSVAAGEILLSNSPKILTQKSWSAEIKTESVKELSDNRILIISLLRNTDSAQLYEYTTPSGQKISCSGNEMEEKHYTLISPTTGIIVTSFYKSDLTPETIISLVSPNLQNIGNEKLFTPELSENGVAIVQGNASYANDSITCRSNKNLTYAQHEARIDPLTACKKSNLSRNYALTPRLANNSSIWKKIGRFFRSLIFGKLTLIDPDKYTDINSILVVRKEEIGECSEANIINLLNIVTSKKEHENKK